MKGMMYVAAWVGLAWASSGAPAWAQAHDEPPPTGLAAEAEHDAGDEAAGHAASHDGDEHGGDHGPSYKLISIDGMAAVWTIVVFVVLLLVLRARAWGPIQQVLTDREKFIADSLEMARRERTEAEALLKKYTEQIDRARAEASAIVGEGRRDGEALKAKIEAAARAEANALIERAKREIGIATETAVKELYDKSAVVATQIAARLIRKEVDAKAHERLIRDSIEELSRLN